MSKIILDTNSTQYSSQKINENFRKIEDEFNKKVLYRDNPPDEPNEVENDIDMNDNRIYNLPEPDAEHEPVTKGFLEKEIGTSLFRKNLRVEDRPIPALPSAAERSNKLLSFDANGNPEVIKPSDDSATKLRMDLADIADPTKGAALVGYSGRTLYDKLRENVRTPYDYGASIDDPIDKDQTAALQALINEARGSYNSSTGRFDLTVHLAHRAWVHDGSLDATMIRQPGMIIENGGIYGRCAGKIMLDLSGSNAVAFRNFAYYGDRINTPAVGILLSRAKINGGFPGAPNMKMMDVRGNGYFSKSTFVNFASEVSYQGPTWFINRSRSRNAYAYVHVGHAGTLDDYVGGLTSEFVDIPTAADGAHSNILHDMTQLHVQRASDISIPIINISKSNPAVVSVSPAALAGAQLSNGDRVYFHNNTGMTELNGKAQTVSNINVGAGTFELTGVDSSGFGTFTGGRLWNQTGPAMLLNGIQMLHARSGYALTYGDTGIVIDAKNGNTPKCIDIELQLEAQAPSLLRIDKPDTPTVIQTLRIRDLSSSQNYSDCVIDDTGEGTMRIDNLELYVNNMGVAPPNKVFKNPGKFNLRNPHIEMPLWAAHNKVSDFLSFGSGVLVAYDVQPYVRAYNGFYYTDVLSNTALTVTASDNGTGYGPNFDIDRKIDSPTNGQGLGILRFTGNNDAGIVKAYGAVRGRAVDVASGSEDGRIEFLAPVAGVDTILAFFQGTNLYIDGTKVLTKQQAAISDSTGGDESAKINAILAALRTHGLIST